MFHQTRIKLTAWYLVIIMTISLLFSLVIYSGINDELERFDRLQQSRQDRIEQLFGDLPVPPTLPRYDPTIILEARQRLILILGGVNIIILLVSGGAGYFLAGRTLRPIRIMLDEQHRFISDASHELRTPLTSLRTEIEVYLRDKNLTLPEAKKLLGSNLEEVINLQILSDNLLQLSRSPMKQQHAQPVALSLIAEKVVKKITPSANKKKIAIEQHIGSETVIGDEISLEQLLMILLDNAIKYSPKNTVVSLAAKKNDHTVLVSVADQGVGIDEKDLPHIFERFYRADKTRNKHVSGYGLGLSIAKKIITEHNGTVQIQSDPKTGTTFLIKFPAAEKAV